jgi:hypothetical protein
MHSSAWRRVTPPSSWLWSDIESPFATLKIGGSKGRLARRTVYSRPAKFFLRADFESLAA